ncbi:UDP-glucuronosyltransferase-like [Trichoplusia ni]|uniref:UDP-glucuronosyltransferase n=1 Tax=Trichoplusia ni TaxID=7111 RepID=A0A7E5W438_TRINI|nr:UDP-glucuronosyltransferase-like [Trichoplusia ni]
MKMDSLKWIIFSCLLCLYGTEAYKILAVFPLPSKSHGILGDNMVKHLLDAGHEVTYITPYYKETKTHPNLKQIDVSANKEVINENTMDIKLVMAGIINLEDPDLVFDMMFTIASKTLENPNVQEMMRNQKFDVVVAEYMFVDLYSSFATVFQCPLVWFSTVNPHWMIMNLIDGPLNPAYNADYTHNRVTPFTFYDRVMELWHQVVEQYKLTHKYYYHEVGAYEKSIVPMLKEKGIPVPEYNEVRYNGSLVLGNSQVAISDAIALPPNYKHIGGYHIDDEVKPLPENLKKIMESNKNGIIYFSLGSNIKSKDLPVEIKEGILDVFKGLKQTVIWKFEEVLANAPKNVHIVQWAPQQSILAHPNLVLFVTHGGLLSITETIHHGVPVVSIPVFADQFQNAKRAEIQGYGRNVRLTPNLPKDLKKAMDDVLGNPSYASVAKELSKAYHHRQTKPKDEINFWIDHVVQTRGAPHLRSVAISLPYYQRYFLDVLAIILISLLTIIYAVAKLWCSLTSKSNGKYKTN